MSKKSIYFSIIIFLFSLNLWGQGQQQGVFALKKSDKSVYVKNINNTLTKSDYLADNVVAWYAGRYGNEKHRGFFEWNITDDVIPDGSTITSARIQITGISSIPYHTRLQAGFYTIDQNLDQASAEYLWNITDWFNNQDENYIGSATSSNDVIDKTFQQGSDFTNAIENSLTKDVFTLGIIDFNEVTHEYSYSFAKANVKLEIHFNRPPVTVTINQVQDDNSTVVQGVNRWDGNQFSDVGQLPAHLTFYVGTVEILQANQSLQSNSPKQKYNNWNELSDVTNHHVFEINSETKNFISNFAKTYETVTIKSTLTDGTNGDNIWFKDPWLIDYNDPVYGDTPRNRGMDEDGPDKLEFKQRPSPFNPDYTTNYNGDVYQGVFLDQRYDIPNNPHYSVKAEAQQTFTAHGENITDYSLGLEGTDVDFQHADQQETAVVFHAANAEARAVYKGHLASSVARATGYNNGRRLCKTVV